MSDIEQFLLNATGFLAQNDYASAIKEYENVVNLDENNPEALKGLGMCCFNLKDNVAATKYFRKALEINPNDATSLYYIASLSMLNNDIDNAIMYAKKVIELRPEFADAYKILFSLYMKKKNFDEILKLHEDFEQKNLDGIGDIPYLAAGTVCMIKKDYTKAVELFKIAKKISPEKVQLLNNLGICYMSLKDYDSAINVLQQSIALDDKNAISYTNLGTVLQQKGDFVNAFNAFNSAFQLEPGNLLNLLNIANISNILKKYDMVIDAYEKMLAINPNLKEVQSSLIGAYIKNSEPEKAINMIDVALKKTPRNVPLLFKKAKVYTELGDFNAASKIYEQILVFKKNSPTIYHAYGILFTKMQDFDKALENLNKAIMLEENNASTHKDLAVIYLMRNQTEYAKDEFDKAIEYGSEDNEVLKECADFYYTIGDFVKADELYKKSLELEQNPFTSLSYAINLIAQNKLDMAFEILEKLLSVLPENPEVLYNLSRIFYAQKDFDKAARLARKAYFHAPTVEVANLLGLSLKACEDFKGAANIFEKIIETYPMNEFIYNDLIECYEKLDNKAGLLKAYQMAYDNLLYNEERTITLINLLKENGQEEQAKKIFDKANFEHQSEKLSELSKTF